VFVRLVLLKKTDFNPFSGKPMKKKIRWVQGIEREVLEFFLKYPQYKDLFYNTKTSSQFERGNTSGGFRLGNTVHVAEVKSEDPLAYE